VALSRSRQAVLIPNRATDLLDLRIKTGNGVIQAVDLTQQLGQPKAMRRFDPPVQRFGQWFPCASGLSLTRLTCGNRYNPQSGLSVWPVPILHNIRGHRRQLDIGIFQELLYPVDQG